MLRKIIKIDENKCTGCGLCVPNCAEGALQIIDGKARLISDLFCDGLGACLGYCPEGAIEIEQREAEPYDEKKVMEYIVNGGANVISAHLNHLKDHGETEFFNQAVVYLKENNIQIPSNEKEEKHSHQGCLGSKIMNITKIKKPETTIDVKIESELTQWPIQLHLISPNASYFKNCDLLIAADCTAFSFGAFHKDFIKNKKMVIACPKLDSNKDIYLEKFISLIDNAKVNTITVVMMEVPCCGGILSMVQKAKNLSSRNIPIKQVMISIQGEILKDEWV